MQVRLGARALFVNRQAMPEPVQPIVFGSFVGFVFRQQMGVAISGSRGCLEPAIAPATVEIEAFDVGFVDGLWGL